MHQASSKKAAVFVDVENVLAAFSNGVANPLSWMEDEGVFFLKRAYGNLQNPSVAPIGERLQDLGFEIVQPRTGKPGKNAADMRLALDALEIALGPNPPEVVVIVSSDCDFVPLVHKLRERHIRVVGAGVAKITAESARRVYDRFVCLGGTAPIAEPPAAAEAASPKVKPLNQLVVPAASTNSNIKEEAVQALVAAIKQEMEVKPGQTHFDLSAIGIRLSKGKPSNILKAAGCSKLSKLAEFAMQAGKISVKKVGGGLQVSLLAKAVHSAPKKDPALVKPGTTQQRDSPQLPSFKAADEAGRLGISLPRDQDRRLLCERVISFFKDPGALFIEPPSLAALHSHALDCFDGSASDLSRDQVEDMVMRLILIGAIGAPSGRDLPQYVALLPLGRQQMLNALNATYLMELIDSRPERDVDPESAAEWLFEEASQPNLNRVAKCLNIIRDWPQRAAASPVEPA